MGWEDDLFALFDDLEGRAEALYDAEREPELADRSHAEYRQVTLASRLMASVDRELTLDLVGVGPVRGRLERVGDGWCLVSGAAQDRLAESGERCVLHLRDGSAREGVVRRVGGDFVELRGAGDRLALVAFDALTAAQSSGGG